MFERIGVERGHCTFCGTWGPCAVLYGAGDTAMQGVQGCEPCLTAVHKAADLLRTLRVARAPKAKATPKKSRKPRTGQPEHAAPYQGPSKHEVGSLVPLADPEPS